MVNIFTTLILFLLASPSLAQDLPKPGMPAIEAALERFNITVPQGTVVTYDETLVDAGETLGKVGSNEFKVRIGPSAFRSWGFLGSILAHELEGHCMQDWVRIAKMERDGLAGKVSAEIDAYRLEVEQAERFGLTKEELEKREELLQEFIEKRRRTLFGY